MIDVRHGGFEDLRTGRFDDGGSNLYVTARGEIERIHRTDLDGDGFPDIVIANSHAYLERGPTRIFALSPGSAAAPGIPWEHRDLPNDSGWLSRAVDLDGDGHLDLVVVNGENGVTSELASYVYWGGPGGLTGERTEFPTAGAYDVACLDLDGDGRLDLVFPSAWTDHHNPGSPRPMHVWRQREPRRFSDATEEFGLVAEGAVSVATGDLRGNGLVDLVVASYVRGYDLDSESLVYWGLPGGGFGPTPQRLPTHGAGLVRLGDLDGDGRPEIVFAGGDEVRIYWNRSGVFDPGVRTILPATGIQGQFRKGALGLDLADVDGDDRLELLIGTLHGVEVRRADAPEVVAGFLPAPYANWIHAVDLDADGRPELVVCRYKDAATYDVPSLIFWNSAAGFSSDRVTQLSVSGAVTSTSADLDGDGRPELVLTSAMSGPASGWVDFPIYVYPGGPDRSFDTTRRLELPTGGEVSNGYVIADLDLDGHADLVLARHVGLRIFHGAIGGPRRDYWTDLPILEGYCMQVHVADLNRDGWLDLVAIVQTYDDRPETRARSSHIFWGGPDGFAPERSTILPTYGTGDGYLADLDGDGWLDLVVSEKSGELIIHHGGPDGLPSGRETRIPLGVRGHPSSITAADLDADGWLDLVVGIGGHYARSLESFMVLWGGPDGYDAARSIRYDGGYSPGQITVGNLGDGALSILAPAYSSASSRRLPWEIFRVEGRAIDLATPRRFPGLGSCHAMPLDVDGDGWVDILVSNHRDDIRHDADTVLYWNGPDGISETRTTRFAAMGPHNLTVRDPGNAMDRGPGEAYVSPPVPMGHAVPVGLAWEADIPEGTGLLLELRWADSEHELPRQPWRGPHGPGSHWASPGRIDAATPARFVQYRATLVSRTGARSPRLRSVTVTVGEAAGVRR